MEENQFLTFISGSETFAVDIHSVKEIKEYSHITTIPLMPNSVLGVINLRGNVVPIIDLQVRIGKEKSKITKRTCIIIVELNYSDEKMDVGLMVDAVSEVIDIPITEIEKAPSFGSKIRNDFIKSIGKIEGKFIIILNIINVLSIDELSVVENVSLSLKE
jgi:purine-binding chemotaxis protein CheW